MVRSYRKYETGNRFGTVCTTASNAVWIAPAAGTRISKNASFGRAFVGANEEVLCWDVKTGELLSRWYDKDNRSEVTCLAECEVQPDLVAAGYADGSIRIWDALSSQVVVAFNGHRSAVTHMRFDREGARLASGSRDTDIIIWNLLSETAEFRLRGHKDQITGISFLRSKRATQEDGVPSDGRNGEEQGETETHLLTTSKDALVKIWDLASPHCIETHVAQTNGECWALAVSPDGEGCITAGNDGELRIWRLDMDFAAALQAGGDKKGHKILVSQGIINRQGKDRTVGLSFHLRQDYIIAHGSEKSAEVWRMRSAEELHRHMQRKRKRRREKLAAAGGDELKDTEETESPGVSDIFLPYTIVRTGGKVRSTVWDSTAASSKSLRLLVATTNNQIELFNITTHKTQQKSESNEAGSEYARTSAVELPGHRADVRTLALSSDDRMLASASSGQLKIWNMRTMSCLRTLECGQALCSAFLPGDRIVLLGTKTGDLELYDISTSTLIESFRAHDGAIWTLAVHPDGKSVVTGSADKSAKFWRFDVVEEDIPGTRRTTQRLKLSQTRQLKVTDDILSITFTPDSRLIALSTLDNTVKVFFVDSLKLFLTLYGHKLPVLNISISSDSKLIATCSADKNVRIWGLDFGDCHKALFAHQDSVMAVSFIPHPVERDEAHILFSASKDGVVKSWDGDKFEKIQSLDGHHGEVWAMVVSRTGESIVTASHDKSIRTWNIGDDLVFLEEERERELEQMYESTLAENLSRDARTDDDARDGQDEVAAASKQTISTLTHGEKIMEALEVASIDLEVMTAYTRDVQSNPNMAVPQRNPIFLALGDISAEEHVLGTLRKIPAPSLNDALLVIPFSTLPTLFTFLALLLRKRMQPDLIWRITYFLLQVHMQQIVSSRQLRATLQEVLSAYETWQEEERRVMGFNLAGLTIMSRDVRDLELGSYVDDAVISAIDVQQANKKRAFASVG